MPHKFFQFLWLLPRRIMAKLITLYQRILSPDHQGILKNFYPYGYCRFTPSCSEYAKQAFLKYGFSIGFIKTIWRLLRCHPWSRGGADPV